MALRSTSGREDDYTPMPWIIEKQLFTKFIKDFYEEMLYDNLHSCSNMPSPDNVFPIKRGNWTLNECIVEGKGLPEMAPQGYYKIILNVTGDVEWGFVSVAKITDKYAY